MDRRRIGIVVAGLAIFALVDGIVLGILSAWWMQTPSDTAQIDADDYVWMVSASYAADGDLSNAQRRLQVLQPDSALTSRLVGESVQRASLKADMLRTQPMLQLAKAMGVDPLELVGDDSVADENGANDSAAPQAFEVVAAPEARVINQRAAMVVAEPTTRHGSAFLAPAMATSTPTRVPTKIPTKTPTNEPVSAPLNAPVTAKANGGNPSVAARGAAPVVVSARTMGRANPVALGAISGPPGVDYVVASVRRLTACENGGNHHLFILIRDAQGNGVPGLPVEVVWPSGTTIVTTGSKVENLPALGITPQNTAGYVNFAMYHGSYRVRVLNGVSQQTDWLTVDINHDEYCAQNDNPQGNSTFHYSYLIVFQKVR